MKTGFFLKLARSNISKNRRFFLPRILSEAGLLCVFYIVFTLRADERILQLRGGQYIEVFMSIGVAVMMLLSVILLFYINSFLMKQRKREFGVYNILGLEKRHICRVLFHETALSSLASVVLGLAMGTLFYKLCSLLICQLLNAEIVLGFYFINARSLALSGAFFLVLDVMAYGVNCVTIARLKPVELLSSANVGEREPKVKWPLLVLGLLALGGGYYISLTTQNPLKALVLFFVAVILVIIGTYFLFVAGSIFVLKALKKNKRFYYNKKHMPAVSGLLYRMKQNAVGLASIAILATGVLRAGDDGAGDDLHHREPVCRGGGDSEAELPSGLLSLRAVSAVERRGPAAALGGYAPGDHAPGRGAGGGKKRPDHKGDSPPGVSDGLLYLRKRHPDL